MSKIDFVSHEYFPEDEYVKEIAYLCLDGKYRVGYVRKRAQNGNMFWSIMTIGVTKGGKKEYFPAFIQDSNFLEKDIKDFLERRSWESPAVNNQAPLPPQQQSQQWTSPPSNNAQRYTPSNECPF